MKHPASAARIVCPSPGIPKSAKFAGCLRVVLALGGAAVALVAATGCRFDARGTESAELVSTRPAPDRRGGSPGGGTGGRPVATVDADDPLSSQPAGDATGGIVADVAPEVVGPIAPVDGARADGTALAADGVPTADASVDNPLGRGLRLWLRFDDDANTTVARDDSGNDNRATLRGLDPRQAWIPGRIGGALDLRVGGNNAHLTVDGSPSLDAIKTGLTVAVWLWRPIGRHGSIVSRRSGPVAMDYQLEIGDGDVPQAVLTERAGGRAFVHTEVKVPANTWVHLALSSDGQIARLFLNGQMVASAVHTADFSAGPTPLLIGTDAASDAKDFKAPLFPRLDDLRLYDRALSPAEIAALASGQRF